MNRHALCTLLSGLLLGWPGYSTAQTLDTDPHLVGWWKFDETTGKRAADATKGGHHAVLEGALAFDTRSVAGHIGKALQFEGNNDGVRIADFKGVTGTKPRTVAVWIKTPDSKGEIVSWGSEDFGKMWMLTHIRGHVGVTPKGGYLYMKAKTSDDAWHHIVAVVQEASPPNLQDNVKLYKDGEPAEIDDIGFLDMYPIETGDQLEVRIGRRFKGALDDLRIYDRALSEQDVRALFTQAGK